MNDEKLDRQCKWVTLLSQENNKQVNAKKSGHKVIYTKRRNERLCKIMQNFNQMLILIFLKTLSPNQI